MKVEPLPGSLGAEIVDLNVRDVLQSPGDERVDALRSALGEYRLLRVRGIDLTPEEFVAFARRFGPVGSLRRANREGAHFPLLPEIKVVSNGQAADGTKVGDGDATENSWHNDGTYLADPTEITFLYGRRSPAHPPRTIFLDLIEAYARMPEALKERIGARRAIHYSVWNHDAVDAPAIAALSDSRRRKTIGPWLPMVIMHPQSGRPCLMPPRQVDCVIEDLDETAAQALAEAIWSYLGGLDCVWGDVIVPDDLLFWDNRFSLHMREAFSRHEERLLWHTTTVGARYEPYHSTKAA